MYITIGIVAILIYLVAAGVINHADREAEAYFKEQERHRRHQVEEILRDHQVEEALRKANEEN